MAESPYSMPLDEFEGRARVPLTAQVEEQAVPRYAVPDWGSGVIPYADGGSGDGDGD